MKKFLIPSLLVLITALGSCTREELDDPTDMSVNFIRSDRQIATNSYAKKDLTFAAKKLNNELLVVVFGQYDRLEFRVPAVSAHINGIYPIKNATGTGDVAVSYRYVGTHAGLAVESDRDTNQDLIEGVLVINNYNAERNTATCSFSVNIKDTKDPRVRNADPVTDKTNVAINGTIREIRLN